MSRPSPAAAIALTALVVAITGTAFADPVAEMAARFTKSDGKRIVRVLPPNSLTGRHIAESRLRLPKPPAATLADRSLTADRATSAASADTAATADTATNANRLEGRVAADFANTGDIKFAVVNAAGTLVRQRGAVAADLVDPPNHTYRVTFPVAVANCSFTATPEGPATVATLSVEVGDDPKNVRVDADSASGFHLHVIC